METLHQLLHQLTITQFAGLCAAPLLAIGALIIRAEIEARGRHDAAQQVLDQALEEQEAREILRSPARLRPRRPRAGR